MNRSNEAENLRRPSGQPRSVARFVCRSRDATCAWLHFTVAAAAIAAQPAAGSERARDGVTFDLQGEKWTYTSAGRTFEGYLLKPEGSGKFPAVIINHGKGGRPDQFSMQWAREMVKWGLVCIAPTLTHVAGTRIQGQDGASEENIARGIDCLAILERLGSVDLSRVAVIGHSMGAYASIGMAGTAPDRFKALAVCAGGLASRAGFAAPTEELAAKIRAPTLIVHGTVDRAVAPSMSAKLLEVLQAHGVGVRRELFAGTDHDLPTNTATRSVVLALIHEHLVTHGVIETANNTPPKLTVPKDITVPFGQPAPPLRFSVGDAETRPDDLVVTVTSSNAKVLSPENLAVSGRGGERVLSTSAAAGGPGPTTVFITVGDGRLMTTRSFTIGFANAEGIVPPPVIQRGPPPGMLKKKAP